MSLLADLWAAPGRRQLFVLRGDLRRNIDVSSPDQATTAARALSAAGADVYCALAAWTPGSTGRKGADVQSCGAFWADLDVGQGKPYKTQQAALGAVVAWAKATKLVPSHIVSSGAGLHVYWQLTADLPADEWRALATALKARWLADGLHADPTRTADIASVLRIPGTTNHKHGQPVTLLHKGAAVELSALIDILGIGPVSACSIEQTAPHLTGWTGPQGDEAIIRGKCAQMQHVHALKGAVSEPLWRAALSVVSRCADGAALIHDYSRGDARYDRADTASKAALTKGPQTCATFASHNPAGCKGCAHAGKITSPINLGAAPAASAASAAPWGESNKGRFLLSPTGIWLSGSEDDAATPVYHIPMWAAGIGKDADERSDERSATLLLRYIDERKVPRSCTMPFHALVSTAKLAEWMASRGLTPATNLKGLHMYISQITRECAVDQDAVKLYKTAGWHGDAFVIGETAYTPFGPAKSVSRSSHRDADTLKPVGSLDAWRAAVNSLAPTNHGMRACLLFGLGAPMLNFSEDKNSAVIAMTGTRPGSGKTLSAAIALSVYGDPQSLMIQGSFTDASLNDSLRGLKNLPFCLDETSTIHPKRLQDIVYHAVGGKEKGRSNKSLRTETSGTWRLPMFVTSNKSFMEQDEALFNEAVRSRILEIPYEDNAVDSDEGEYLHGAITRNAGTAAPVLLDWMARNQASLPALFTACVRMVGAMQDGIPQRARFGKWALAAGLAGGMIAKKIGLIDWDPVPTIRAMSKILKTQHLDIRDEKSRVAEAVAGFVSTHNAEISRWESYGVCTTANGGETLRNPVGRQTKHGTFVQIAKLREYLRDQGIAFSAFKAWAGSGSGDVPTQVVSLVPKTPQVRCYLLPASLLPVSDEA